MPPAPSAKPELPPQQDIFRDVMTPFMPDVPQEPSPAGRVPEAETPSPAARTPEGEEPAPGGQVPEAEKTTVMPPVPPEESDHAQPTEAIDMHFLTDRVATGQTRLVPPPAEKGDGNDETMATQLIARPDDVINAPIDALSELSELINASTLEPAATEPAATEPATVEPADAEQPQETDESPVDMEPEPADAEDSHEPAEPQAPRDDSEIAPEPSAPPVPPAEPYPVPAEEPPHETERPSEPQPAPTAEESGHRSGSHRSRLETEARAFGGWLRTCLVRPSAAESARPWYAPVAILMISLFSVLACLLVVAHGVTVLESVPVLGPASAGALSKIAPAVFLASWIVFSLFDYGSIGIAWLMLLIEGDPTPFGTFHDRVVHALAPWAAMNLAAFLLALVRLDPLAILLWALATVTRIVWMTSFVWNGEVRRGLDPQWTRFLCALLQGLLVAVLFVILGAAVLAAL
ncbi:hypothetical protein [Bifidobacterium santillanense]|nr:hypothetical protein [Bifidobacterium santillanense]